MDVCKDLDEYTQTMQQHRRMLENAKKKQGQRPHDRKERDVMLYEFMMTSMARTSMARTSMARTSMATTASTGSKDTRMMQSSFVPPAYPPCTAALDTLEPIAIEDLGLRRIIAIGISFCAPSRSRTV
jgi:hypothetical protein